MGVATVSSKRVIKEYENLIRKFNSEFAVLLNTPREDLEKAVSSEIAEGIIRAREGKVFIEPGYDGVFGKVKVFSQEERKKALKSNQKTLF